MSMRHLYVRALKDAGLLLDSTDGAFRKWMHRFGEHDSGRHIDEQLGLEEETHCMKEEATEVGLDLFGTGGVDKTNES
jgi:hypothetical protein